jgi:penicillin amidase
LFIETIDPTNSKNYLTPEGSKPFDEHREIIHVKHAADVVLTVRTTRHGPVLSDINEKMQALAGQGKVMALAFTGLGNKDTTTESLLRLNQAHNAAELVEALKLYQTPPQNIVYADKTGAIGFINPGLVPVRKNGNGLVPAEGASGDYDWVDTIALEQVPRVSNPEAGFIFNANNAVVGSDASDYFGQDWEEPYRAQRIQQFFDTPDKYRGTMSR